MPKHEMNIKKICENVNTAAPAWLGFSKAAYIVALAENE